MQKQQMKEETHKKRQEEIEKELEVELPSTGEVNPYLLIEQEEKRKKLSEQKLKEKDLADQTPKDEQFDRNQSIEQALIDAIQNSMITKLNQFSQINNLGSIDRKQNDQMNDDEYLLENVDFSEFY